MSELTFLRPYWLLALLPALYLSWALWQRLATHSDWRRILPAAFQPYLLADQRQRPRPWPIVGLLLSWILAIVALSGPSWKTEPIAVQQQQSGVVIVLDLSLSMFADDLAPNRIRRVQYKLTDLLNAHPHWRVGLVAYAGSAHIISPISDDNSTLLSLIPHLQPLIMPATGANAPAGFELANQLLSGASVQQGHIIWITDDIDDNQRLPIQRALASSGASLSLLAVGTEQGGAIAIPQQGLMRDNENRLIQAAVPLTRLTTFARDNGARFARLQLDDSDLAELAPPFVPTAQDPAEHTLSQALDYGVYLLWLLVPLLALGARRGWLSAWSSIALLPLLISASHAPPTLANDKPPIQLSDRWREMFLTPDQKGYQAWLAGDLLAAERQFDDPAWRGSVLYRQGRYNEAAEAFAQDPSAQGHYNRGNALAQLQQLDAAEAAYQTALTLQPTLASAQRNLALVQQAKAAQQSAQNSAQNDSAQASEPTSRPAKKDASPSSSASPEQSQAEHGAPNTETPAQTKPEQSASEDSGHRDENSDTSGQANGDGTEPPQPNTSQQNHQPEPAQPASNDSQPASAGLASDTDSPTDNDTLSEQQREQHHAEQAWLNQIRDEPGLFLKRKFDYQYQQSMPQDTTGKPW
jgi:Ca-activated chloride channel family protein